MKAKAPVNFPVEASERKRVFWILIKANVELVLIGIYQIWTGEGRRNSPEKYSSLLKAHLFFLSKEYFLDLFFNVTVFYYLKISRGETVET